jgi:hypothetical protein
VSAVRNVWSDLVDKRLWPVALLLVVALVAIPVVLAKPAPKGPTARTSEASTPGPQPLTTSPASIRSNTGGAPVLGKFKDPFRQQHLVKQATVPTAASSTGAGTGDAKSSGGGGSGGSSGSSGGSGGGSSDEETVTKLEVKFGRAGGKRTVREITIGSPLPASTNPLIVFLDFGKDGTKPVFLVSSDVVKTEGDGSCKPSKSVCSELTLDVGATQFFDAQNGDQYQLDVLGIVKP